jgi:hypothetical protein
MTHTRTLPESVALMLLARNGIAAIWQLNLQAADAYRMGYPCSAASILEVAEAAEEAWLRVEGTRDFAV